MISKPSLLKKQAKKQPKARCSLHALLLARLFSAAALPTLDIAEGALDKLFGIYKQLLPSMGGYLTHAGELNRARLEMVLHQLAALELDTLEQRAQVCIQPPTSPPCLPCPFPIIKYI